MQERKYNYDLLRIVSTVAVISIHVSANYLDAIDSAKWLGIYYTKHILVSTLFNILGRFAVPCFVMMSGAFNLDDKRNADYTFYYKKTFKKIGIPTILFSIVYFAYSLLNDVILSSTGESFLKKILGVLKTAFTGNLYYHMWYLYMMAGIYLLVPLIIRLKEDIGERKFEKLTYVFGGASLLGLWTSTHKLQWDPGLSICYLGYFMLGYIIKKKTENRSNNVRAFLMIGMGVFLLFSVGYYKYIQKTYGIEDLGLLQSVFSPIGPLIGISSILIFIGFSELIYKRNIVKLSNAVFGIYLFHAGVWDFLSKSVTEKMDNRIVIPFMIVATFFVSLVVYSFGKRIWNRIETRWLVSEKICQVIHLK